MFIALGTEPGHQQLGSLWGLSLFRYFDDKCIALLQIPRGETSLIGGRESTSAIGIDVKRPVAWKAGDNVFNLLITAKWRLSGQNIVMTKCPRKHIIFKVRPTIPHVC